MKRNLTINSYHAASFTKLVSSVSENGANKRQYRQICKIAGTKLRLCTKKVDFSYFLAQNCGCARKSSVFWPKKRSFFYIITYYGINRMELVKKSRTSGILRQKLEKRVF